MARASLSRTGDFSDTHAGAVAPKAGPSGSLLSQYSLRLGDTLLRHRAELAERASRIEAQMANQVKTEFIANISHELRTPLNSIIGFSKMLKDVESTPVEPAQVAEYAQFINDSAMNLLAIVNDVITISKLQSGKMGVDVDALDVVEGLRSCIDWAQETAKSSGHGFSCKVDENLPLILADPEHLKDTVQRLLGNAFRFTPQGGTVALTAKPTSGNKMLICVSDTGIGMSDEDLVVALTEFGQVDNRLDREGDGTGLGLPIAQALTELQGGTFIVKSEKDKGTNVVLLFDILSLPNVELPEGAQTDV